MVEIDIRIVNDNITGFLESLFLLWWISLLVRAGSYFLNLMYSINVNGNPCGYFPAGRTLGRMVLYFSITISYVRVYFSGGHFILDMGFIFIPNVLNWGCLKLGLLEAIMIKGSYSYVNKVLSFLEKSSAMPGLRWILIDHPPWWGGGGRWRLSDTGLVFGKFSFDYGGLFFLLGKYYLLCAWLQLVIESPSKIVGPSYASILVLCRTKMAKALCCSVWPSSVQGNKLFSFCALKV